MHFRFILCLLVVLTSCGETKPKTDKPSTEGTKPISVQIQRESLTVYQLQTNAQIDSLLYPIEEFTAFKNTIEDLSKLNPTGIDPFLEEALIKSNKLLKKKMPEPFNVPDIKSRLKVIKTTLLKAYYYSQEKKEEELNLSLKEIYTAYRAYLMRIEDFSQNQLEESESNKIVLKSLPSD